MWSLAVGECVMMATSRIEGRLTLEAADGDCHPLASSGLPGVASGLHSARRWAGRDGSTDINTGTTC